MTYPICINKTNVVPSGCKVRKCLVFYRPSKRSFPVYPTTKSLTGPNGKHLKVGKKFGQCQTAWTAKAGMNRYFSQMPCNSF